MAKKQPQQIFNTSRMIKKFFLSSFVVFTFIAYVIHQRFTNPDSALNPTPTIFAPQDNSSTEGIPTFLVQPTSTNSSIVTPQVDSSVNMLPTSPILPTPTIQPSATPHSSLYKDGTYTGPQVDVYYGLVKVQVTVQNGNIADVEFLQYPSDRRTSVRINTIAMPYLQQEAIQVQSANVNIISGATLTSEGFMMSLNAALNSAKN